MLFLLLYGIGGWSDNDNAIMDRENVFEMKKQTRRRASKLGCVLALFHAIFAFFLLTSSRDGSNRGRGAQICWGPGGVSYLSVHDICLPTRIVDDRLPESSRSRSGLRFSTELRFDGIGKLGFGRFFKAAKACWTASCRTSVCG